ncbi:MAG: DNA-binding protein [Candidatus Thiodiazotropha sp. (ex Codakia orbicularis)]|nr:DNA-binding protein [Candidatus Thiodiazotropha sp. (ex Codakia orbicularis)]
MTSTAISQNNWWESNDRMTREECAEFIGITPGSLSSALSRGVYSFPKYRVGKQTFFRKSEVLADIEKNRVTGGC